MKKKKRLRATVPFFMMLAALTSCSQDERTPQEPNLEKAVSRLGPGCVALDEFTPALASWATLDTSSATSANGYDITVELQKSIDALVAETLVGTNGNLTSTLYIPHGTWKISATLNMQYAVGVNIVGEDPLTTTLLWGPSSNPTYPDMFRVSDVTQIKISRLTFDGAGQGRIGIHLFQSGCYDAAEALKSATHNNNNIDPGPVVAPFDEVTCQITRAAALGSSIPGLTGVELNDDVFRGLNFGLVSGPYTRITDANVPLDFAPGIPRGISSQNGGEVLVRRSRFDTISQQGISVIGGNVFNWLVADSEFNDCYRGIQVTEHGAVNIVNNLFSHNGLVAIDGGDASHNYKQGADIVTGGDSPTVIRENVSLDSRAFLSISMNAAVGSADVSGNYIRSVGNVPTPFVAATGTIVTGLTQMTLFDNYIQMDSFDWSPALFPTRAGVSLYLPLNNTDMAYYPRMTDGGNTFITSDTNCDSHCNGSSCSFYKPDTPSGTPRRITADVNNCGAIGSTPVPAAASAALASAQIPVAPVASGRTVFDAKTTSVTVVTTTGTTTATIAQHCTYKGVGVATTCGDAINQWLAAQTPTTPTFLFFSRGGATPLEAYYVDKTIEVPANLDIVIGGEGPKSQLTWVGTSVAVPDPYVFHLNSPSKAFIRDLSVNMHPQPISGVQVTRPGGILVDTPDTVGGLVWMDTVAINNAKSEIDLLGLDNVAVRADLSGASDVERVFGVTGGGKAAPALGGSANTRGILAVAGGSGSRASYIDLRNWGKAVLVNTDNEAAPEGIDLGQSGYLTFATGRFLPGAQEAGYGGFFADQPNVVVRSTFRGRAAFMGLSSTTSTLLAAAATPDAQVLSLDNWYQVSSAPSPFQAPLPTTCPNLTMNQDTDCTFFSKLRSSGGTTATQMALQDGTGCGAGGHSYCANLSSSDPAHSGPLETSAFLTATLVDERAARMGPPSACASTAVRLHRLSFGGFHPSPATPAGFMGPGIRVQRY